MIKKLIPPEQWRIPVIILMGIIVGLSLFLLRISNAASYLSDKSETCINCHVMNPQYATWNHSSHREVATVMIAMCHIIMYSINIISKQGWPAPRNYFYSACRTPGNLY